LRIQSVEATIITMPMCRKSKGGDTAREWQDEKEGPCRDGATGYQQMRPKDPSSLIYLCPSRSTHSRAARPG
jgi:hypothetical protein